MSEPTSVADACPACGATLLVRRRIDLASGVYMTPIGCTDDWHPKQAMPL